MVCAQQSATKIRESREKTLREIDYANKLLLETQGKTNESLNEVNLINHKLSKRREYLVGLEVEVDLISQSIQNNQKTINDIESEITKIKKVYALMVFNLYKNKSSNFRIMYLLASENLNQLYKRIRTIKMYNSYLEKQKNRLDLFKEELSDKNDELFKLKSSKDVLVNKTKKEAVTIQKEINQKNQTITQLKKKQKEIEEEIKNKEKTARKLENELKRIIEEEKKKTMSSGSKSLMTPEDKIISNDFEKNAGRLPWPMEQGIITGKFGEHRHPDYKSVIIRNDGIFISTSVAENVRSIFKGIVSRVFQIPGEKYTVIIKHGQYYSLYHNLIRVTVKAGQTVNTKETIGTVYTNENTKETILYFQIWRETEKRDPEIWLAPYRN
jgi:septal ring factor EnvC (AmiA/AmiB activator)